MAAGGRKGFACQPRPWSLWGFVVSFLIFYRLCLFCDATETNVLQGDARIIWFQKVDYTRTAISTVPRGETKHFKRLIFFFVLSKNISASLLAFYTEWQLQNRKATNVLFAGGSAPKILCPVKTYLAAVLLWTFCILCDFFVTRPVCEGLTSLQTCSKSERLLVVCLC